MPSSSLVEVEVEVGVEVGFGVEVGVEIVVGISSLDGVNPHQTDVSESLIRRRGGQTVHQSKSTI